jgi:hypothetical protein
MPLKCFHIALENLLTIVDANQNMLNLHLCMKMITPNGIIIQLNIKQCERLLVRFKLLSRTYLYSF